MERQKTREEIDEKYKWDLTSIFKDEEGNEHILYQLELYSKEDPTKIRDVLWMLIANRYINSSVIGNYINNR